MFDSVFNSSSTNTHTLTCVCLFLCIYGVPLMTDSFVGTRYCTSLTFRVKACLIVPVSLQEFNTSDKNNWLNNDVLGRRPTRPENETQTFSSFGTKEAGAQCAEPTIVSVKLTSCTASHEQKVYVRTKL